MTDQQHISYVRGKFIAQVAGQLLCRLMAAEQHISTCDDVRRFGYPIRAKRVIDEIRPPPAKGTMLSVLMSERWS